MENKDYDDDDDDVRAVSTHRPFPKSVLSNFKIDETKVLLCVNN